MTAFAANEDKSAKREFLSLLTNHRVGVSNDRQSEARYLANEQANAWNALLSAIEGAISKQEDRDQVRAAIHVLRRGIETQPAPSVSEAPDGAWIVERSIPVIHPEAVAMQLPFIKGNGWFCLAAITFVTRNIISFRHLARSLTVNGEPVSVLSDPRVTVAYIEITALLAEQKDLTIDALRELNATRTALDAEMERLDKIQSMHRDLMHSIERRWDSFRLERFTEIENLKDQLSDAIRFEASTNLWRKRTVGHLYWMLASFIVMGLGTGLVVWAVLSRALPELDPGPFEILTRSAYPTQKLVLISLCVIGAAWVLRFVARSIVDNMTLRADAQHRQSMLDTYLALRGEVGLKDEERAIILTALFRPLPGQAPDENPPTPAGEAFQKLIQR
ncbi:DUF6161 domain-containing protein [Bosea sp. MMO-172]|uniref:DUF6161 domain-containing protein n=1 Tax=Bosea sp. MMO-172 TaxID=3127885 RepID=UPI003016434D